MSELLAFAQLGFRHIVGIDALDHILFLVALAAIYRFHDARRLLAVVTAFTVGHSVTLALAVTGVLRLPSALIEFLIPVTILATGVENLLVRDRERAAWGGRYRPVFAGIFGLVHGAGFANYLAALFVDHLAVPLLGFNLGIEAGQVVVLLVLALAFHGLDALIRQLRPGGSAGSALRVRVVAVSSVVVGMGAFWSVVRRPW